MFQNEKNGMIIKSLLVMGLCLLLPVFLNASTSKLTNEEMLASVSIDDLFGDKKKASVEEPVEEVQSNLGGVDISLKVPKTEITFLLDEPMILDEIRHQLGQRFELKNDFRISFDHPWEEIKMNSLDWELVVTSFPSKGLRSRFFVSFELWIAGKRNSSWREGVSCELWIDAYVAVQQIDRGTVMRNGLVAIKPVDSLSLYQGPVELGTNLTDYVVVNGLKAGEPLFWRDLKERPLIHKNAFIDVVAEDGLLKITLRAKALEDGVKGQIIRIRNLQSNNDIQAEVIGVNQAKVYL